MTFDIRLPIGAMFSILGLLLVGYGALSDDEIYRRSFDINLNLIWGAVLLVFGGVMWILGRRGSSAAQGKEESAPDPELARHPDLPSVRQHDALHDR